jgi:hypothetical protein
MRRHLPVYRSKRYLDGDLPDLAGLAPSTTRSIRDDIRLRVRVLSELILADDG